MNREIKFRAIGLDGEVYYGTYHYSNDKKYHYILSREKFNKYSDEYYSLHDKEVHPIHPDTLSQFTGLQDKNGVDIYEGDILKFKQYVGGNFVEYRCETLEVVWNRLNAGFRFRNTIGAGGRQPFDSYEGHELEIIGNIHSNPELLNDK